MPRTLLVFLIAMLGALAAACRTTPPLGPPAELSYVGSSTVGAFIADSRIAYPAARFRMVTAPESDGGEAAILESAADIGGVAREPRAATLLGGVRATLIGRDAIAIVVPADLGVEALTRDELRRVFSGSARGWAEFGGPDIPIRPFVVAEGSATRRVLRESVLRGADVVGASEVRPDRELVARVASEPGGIGAISFSFLEEGAGVKALAVDGHVPSVANFDYPFGRPLYLLWRPGKPAVEAFVNWATSAQGQRVVMGQFVGVGVRGSVGAEGAQQRPALGTLVVATETREVQDGGLLYYLHRPYEICTRHGQFLRRVRNHRGQNDEDPTPIELEPGIYLVRAGSRGGQKAEFFVTIRPGAVTTLDVPTELESEERE